MPNKYPGKCCFCHMIVPVGLGVLWWVGRRSKVAHRQCYHARFGMPGYNEV